MRAPCRCLFIDSPAKKNNDLNDSEDFVDNQSCGASRDTKKTSEEERGEGDDDDDGEEDEEKEDVGDEQQSGETNIGILADMLENLDDFVVEPAPQGSVVKCRITRDRKGMDRGN